MSDISGSIGSLWVEIGARISKFETEMANVSSTVSRTVNDANSKLASIDLGASFKSISTNLDAVFADFDKRFAGIEALGSRLTSFGLGISAAITAPILALGKSAITAATDMDSLVRGLTAVSKSGDPVAAQLERLKEVAKLPGLGFEEAIRGSTNLQAAGFSAKDAEGALKGFGNALATVGKGKADLKGVVLALSQIASKGKISAEEINQLAERVPQIRQVMKSAFGTADTKALQKAGISAEDFVRKVTAELLKLPMVTGGLQNDFENLSDKVNQTLTAIGNNLKPVVSSALGVFNQLLDWAKAGAEWFGKLPAPVQNAAIAIAAMVTAVGPLLLGIGALATAFTAALPALTALSVFLFGAGATAGALVAPAIAIAAVVTALVALGTWVHSNWEPIKAVVFQAWDGISDIWGAAWGKVSGWLTGLWTGIATKAASTWDSIKTTVINAWDGLEGVWAASWGAVDGWIIGVWSSISASATDIWGTIKSVVLGAWSGLSESWNRAWGTVAGWLTGVWSGIASSAVSVWGTIKDTVIKAWDGLSGAWETAWTPISGWLSGIWSQIGSVASNTWGAIKSAVFGVWDDVSKSWGSIWDTTSGKLTGSWSDIAGAAVSIWEPIKATVLDVWNNLFGTWSSAWGPVTGWITGVWSGIAEAASTIWASIQTTIAQAWDSVSDAWGGVWNGIAGWISGVWTGIAGSATSIWDGIKSTVLQVWDGLSDLWSSNWGPVASWLSGVWTGIAAAASTIWDGIKQTVVRAWDNLDTLWASAWGPVSTLLTGAWSSISSSASNIWNPIAEFFGKIWDGVGTYFYSAWQGIQNTLNAAWGSIKSVAITVWGAITGALGSFLEAAAKIPGVNKLINLDEAWNSAKKASEELKKAGSATEDLKKQADAAGGGAGKPIPKLAAALGHVGDKAKEAEEKIKPLKYHNELLEAAVNLNAAAHKKLGEEIAAAKAKLADWGSEMDHLLGPTDALNTSIGTVIASMQDVAKNATPPAIAAINSLKGTAADLDTAFKALGITSATEYQRVADEATKAYDVIKGSGIATPTEENNAMLKMLKAQKDAMIANGQDIPDEMQAMLDKIGNAASDPGTGIAKATTAFQKFSQDVSESVGRVAEDLVKDLFSGEGSFAEKGMRALKSLGQAVLTSFTDPFAKAANDLMSGVISDLLGGKGLGGIVDKVKELGSSIAGVFGGGGSDIVGEVTGAGGPAASIPGTGGGAGSAAGAAAGSSIAGIAGAVGSIAGAVSGIIGNFQNAHQETSLNAIEHNTRYSMMYLGERGDGGILGAMFKVQENTQYLPASMDGLNQKLIDWLQPLDFRLGQISEQITFAQTRFDTITQNTGAAASSLESNRGVLQSILAEIRNLASNVPVVNVYVDGQKQAAKIDSSLKMQGVLAI
jgi:tape measure domain-containing protein